MTGAVEAAGAADYNTHLTRAPYLTDLVGLHVIVNFATDQSGTTASVTYGPFDGTTCTLPSVQSATRSTVKVGTVSEYQWKASLDAPERGPVLLPGNARRHRPARRRRLPRLHARRHRQARRSPSRSRSSATGGSSTPTATTPISRTCSERSRRSGVRFAVTTGDNGYPSGSQTNYGDLAAGRRRRSGAIFGARFWPVPGASVPLFTASGNHGLSGTAHARSDELAAGRRRGELGRSLRQRPLLLCQRHDVDELRERLVRLRRGARALLRARRRPGAIPTRAPRASMRTTTRRISTPGTPEYQWLLADLQSHPSGLKFAFSHYPFYSDDKSQGSDTFLQGPSSLEGLLAQYGVNIAFNGHSHVYERNFPSAPGYPVTYITGGGGGTLEPIGPCHAFDAYGLGWSPTRLKGTSCGAAPTADIGDAGLPLHQGHGRRYDGHGRADRRARANLRRADVFLRQRDRGHDDRQRPGGPDELGHVRRSASTRRSRRPRSHARSTAGRPRHARARSPTAPSLTARTPSRSPRPPPPGPIRRLRSARGRIDATAPTVPGSVVATPLGPSAVGVSWSASSDAGGLAGYDVTRDGVVIGSAGASQTRYSDTTAAPSTTYQYAVRARDAAGNGSVVLHARVEQPHRPPCPPSEWLRSRAHGLDVVERARRRGRSRAQRRLRGRGEHRQRRHLREEERSLP